MKRLYVLMLISSMSYAGGDKTSIADYVQIHKPYMSLACVDAQNQAAIDACSKRSLKMSMEHMNRLLNTLYLDYNQSEPELIKFLKVSQNDWRAYMESTCRVETYYSRGGTGFDSIWNACLEAKTNERASFLNWMLENP